MAATDILPASPMTPGQVAPWSSFDEYLDFSSPLATPRLAPLATPSSFHNQQASSQQQSIASQSTQLPGQASTSGGGPPPTGSSPEVLFRYYLAAELRRIGSSADEAIIDKYVAQHYESFTKAMDRQQIQSNETDKAPLVAPASNAALLNSQQQQQQQQQSQDEFSGQTNVAAFRSSPPTGPSSAPYLLSNDAQEGQSINPHLMELSSVHQPFTVSRLPTTGDKQMTPSVVTPLKRGKFRDPSADHDMSEDEDDKDTLADLVNDYKMSSVSPTSTRISTGLTAEETPIAGSIMGPANELRPDPEAYRKLSSKEKRQLRNKISARNFRTRRKEHIAHLEQQVADRDTIIEGLRQQLAQVNVHNKELTDEVRVLKTKSISNTDVSRIIEALQKSATTSSTTSSSSSSSTANTNHGNEMGPPSHLLRSSSSSSLSETINNGRPLTPSMLPSSPRSNSPRPLLTRPNMRKDLPSSSSANSTKSFWGGELGGMGNSFMSVHTVLVPHLMNIAGSQGMDAKVKDSTPGQLEDDEGATLSQLVSEKLKLVKEDDSSESSKTKTNKKDKEADVNEALVSLLGVPDVAPPSYSEAITAATPSTSTSSATTSSLLDVSDERIRASVYGALNKAFSSVTTPSSSSTGKGASPSYNGASYLDASKIQALLEGRATLVLYDEKKGQLWKEEQQEMDNRRPSYISENTVTI